MKSGEQEKKAINVRYTNSYYSLLKMHLIGNLVSVVKSVFSFVMGAIGLVLSVVMLKVLVWIALFGEVRLWESNVFVLGFEVMLVGLAVVYFGFKFVKGLKGV